MALSVGDSLPDFQLRIATAEGVEDFDSASLRKGNAVIAFFPLAFTGVCTKEMCDFRDNLARFEELDATVVGFSIDTPFSNQRFAKEQGLGHGIVSDPNRTVVGDIWETMTVGGVDDVAKRGVLVLKDGKVAWSWITDNPGDWIGSDEVAAALAA